MATLAVQVISQESETVSSASANAARENHSGTVTEALVALSSNEIEGCLAKQHSADSAVLSCKSNGAVAESICAEEREQSDSAVSSQSLDSMTGTSEGQDSDTQSKEENKLSVDSKCSQQSSTSESSVKSIVSSSGKSDIDSSKFVDENSNSSSHSTLKANDEENSRSSTSSSKTIKTCQATNEESNDESNSRSSLKSSSRRSSPEKQSQSQSTVKSTQSAADDISDDDSRDSSINSHCRRTKTKSQIINDESDNESNSRSTLKSSSTRSSPEKQKPSQTTTKSSQSDINDLSDGDSRASCASSHSKSTKASSQIVNDKSDNENNSRSSFKSSRRSSPEKQSQSQSTTKSSQSANHDLLEDNETRSSFTSSQSRSIKKSSQPVIDKSDDETNSTSSFKLNSNKSTPAKENENSEPKKKYFSIVDSDSEDDIIVPKKSNLNKSDTDSDSAVSDDNKKSKTKKSKKIKNVFDSDSDEDSVKDKKLKKKKKKAGDQSNSDEDKRNSDSMNKSHKLSSLIDSESESDSGKQHSGSENVSAGEENNAEKPKKGKKTSEKKRTGTARASKDAAMQQIYSETQRLIRESQLSLPYHRPKQRTLQEFLNRKKINTSIPEIPKNLTSAEKVKMFPEMISKVVEEKEKEAEIFYQSSDSEEDERTEEPMEVDECNKDNQINTENTNNAESSNAINISDTQKLTQDYIQDSHNKREILQQRSLDFGVPRKLFMEDLKDTEDSENTQKDECPSNEENGDSENLVQLHKKPKEAKRGLRESSIPKKLFTADTEEMEMEVDALDGVGRSEEKTENIKESKESAETSKASPASTEKKTSLEDSTEEFVLHLPETEASNKVTEISKANDTSNENEDQESIMIGETPFKSHKELGKADTLKSDETEKSKNILETLNEDLNKDDEIIDHNVLRADFGLPPELDEPVKKPTMREKLLASAMKFKPMIKASPGAMIDFTDSGQIKEGVTKLLDRFARHSAVHAKSNVDDTSEIKVLRTEGSGNDINVIEEILPFKKAIVEDDPKKESKPGEKLKKLREDLKRKIVTARNEEWKQKEDKEKADEEEEAKCKGDDFYADLPDEEEILEDEESAESEPEENDIQIIDKPRKKCNFGDDEAEESEDEGAEDYEINENEEENEEEEEEEEEVGEKEEVSEDDETEKEEEEESEDDGTEKQIGKNADKQKKLKRIIRPFDEDSNQSETSLSNDALPKQTFDRTKTDEDMFASQTSNGSDVDGMPPFQPRSRCGSDARSQTCKTPLLKSNNILSMISPVAQLTCLNTSLDSERKSASKTNSINLGDISATKSPSDKSNQSQSNCHLEKMISLPKKLFEDPPESVNDEELLAICSGKFTNTQSSGVPVLNTQNGVTDSQLLAICSGAFTSQSINEKKSDSANPVVAVGDETSQDITLTLDEDEESRNSPNKKSPSAKKSDESMFSNDSKSPVKLPSFGVSAFKNPMEAWLSKAKPKPMESQKRKEVTDSQLMDICSGEFPSQTINSVPSDKSVISKEEQNKLFFHPRAVNDEELLALCSGKFPDTQISGIPSLDLQNGFQKKLFDKQSNNVNEDDLLAICSGQFPDTQMSGLPSINTQKKSISTAPISSSNEKEDVEDSETPLTGYTIVSSSEDEGNKAKMSQKKKKIFKKKKKKVQKLALSDDEDDEPKEFSDEEEDLDELGDEDDEKYVDYDSEENEVITVSKKDIKKVATKYLENEAELSESDWDSADEDEQDLDKLEFEEGDAEEIDEDKMKDELDKIHMKRVMDEDQREVRMLQELLFDDGDLHSEGAGRERKFKWKNIDNIEDDHLEPRTEHDIDGIDDEIDTAAEIQMRKIRYERQKFLEEQEKNLEKQLDDDFSECQLGKLGLKLVSMRSSSKSSTEELQTVNNNPSGNNSTTAGNRLTNVTNKSVTTKSFSFSNVRGSFLARGEETLIRIAKNLPEKNTVSINAVRNRKFVFEHLSPSVSKDSKDDEQENDDTPVKDKNDKSRKRKIFSSQTPRTTKKMKVDERKAGKKLF